ncbi:tRNA pseudouridine(38-40) synthase TruA [Hydrogenimonas sp.]
MRVKAVVAYDGSAFYGFQSQTTTPKTVMGALNRAAKRLGIGSPIVGSGRTDRGVHATGQVIHFDLPPHWVDDLPKLLTMFNRLLFPHIRIKHIAPAAPGFHARFDAKVRIYRYILKSTPPIPFEAKYLHHEPALSPQAAAETLALFEGTHDFALFHKSGSDPATTVRTIHATRVVQRGRYMMLYLAGDAFLRSQVRLIVGAVCRVARGELSHEEIREQLAGKRRHTTALAPAEGLYLARVIYEC